MTREELQAAVKEHGGIRPAARALGMGVSTLWYRVNRAVRIQDTDAIPDHGFVPEDHELSAPILDEGGVHTLDFWAEQQQGTSPTTRRYILTSAQNNCMVHEQFLKNLEALATHIDAKILVSFTVYDRQSYRGLVARGDSGIGKTKIWYDKAIRQYAANSRCRLHRRLAFCGELDILATTKKPLDGLESYCGRSSIIIPHNRFAMQCVESRRHQMPKEMMTTGSVTFPRFIQRKAGQTAHFHHVIGALLVEVTPDGYWYTHHLNAENDGSFYWLNKRVEKGKVKRNPRIDALILGDIHHEKLDLDQSNIMLHDVIPTLSPTTVVVHDLIDFTSRNHHNRDDALFRVQQRDVRVEDELHAAGQWLQNLECCVGEVVVARSNHDEAIERWIKETDWREDPINGGFYLDIASWAVKQIQAGVMFGELNLLEHVLKQYLTPAVRRARFLRRDESYEVSGIEVGMHGHVGPTGSRGTPRAFSRLGFKTFTAHTHSPSIVDGCYTVGVLGRLDMGYNTGPSKWMHAHGIIYPNGKRAFIFVKNGKWRA